MVSAKSGSPTHYHCSGTISDNLNIYTNKNKNIIAVSGFINIANATRTSNNPGVQIQTTLRPKSTRSWSGTGHIINGTAKTVYPETSYAQLNTSGVLLIQCTETFVNMASSATLRICVNFFDILNS